MTFGLALLAPPAKGSAVYLSTTMMVIVVVVLAILFVGILAYRGRDDSKAPHDDEMRIDD